MIWPWKISWSWPFKYTGYNVDEDRAKLKRICDEAVKNPTLRSIKNSDGSWTTFCNLGVYHILEDMGWRMLLPPGPPKMANELVEWLKQDKDWRIGTGAEAHQHANEGRPTIAGEFHPVHGHVAHIYPATAMGHSPSLNKDVPFCANVGAVPHRPEDEGKDLNAVIEISRAFPVANGEPLYFLYCGNVV